MKRRNTGVPVFMSVARFAGVVSPLNCADAFEIQRKCALELFLVVFKMARPHNTRTRTHAKAPLVAVTEMKTLKYGYCWQLYRGYHNAKSLRYDTGSQQQQTP